jgi:predicted enzyme related to lactoylglutathione lyase
MNLNSILLGSEQPEELAAYYRKLFGEPTWEMDGYVGWQLGQGGFTVGPHSEVKGRNPSPGRVIWNLETPDVKSEFDRLVQAGAQVVREPYELGEGEETATIATLTDPDGNYFQLVSPMG